MTQVAYAGPAGPTLPRQHSTSRPPPGTRCSLVAQGTGVPDLQVQRDRVGTFVAPEADLVGDNGKVIDPYFVGPTWQTEECSKVEGTVQQRATVNLGCDSLAAALDDRHDGRLSAGRK